MLSSLPLVFVTLCCLFSIAPSTHALQRTSKIPVTDEDVAVAVADIRSHQQDADSIIQLATAGQFKGVTYNRLAEFTDTVSTTSTTHPSLAYERASSSQQRQCSASSSPPVVLLVG